MSDRTSRVTQCQNPRGWIGRFVLRNMNARHSKVTDWGLSHVNIGKQDLILDVGCGGGPTVSKLAGLAEQGKVFGVDHSAESVAMAVRINQQWAARGRVELQQASVSCLPFAEEVFNLITAIETHFWWPALVSDLKEVLRVLKPGGTLVIIAEVYKGAEAAVSKAAEKYAEKTGMALLSVEEHRELLVGTGCRSVQVITEPKKGWICCIGVKPAIV